MTEHAWNAEMRNPDNSFSGSSVQDWATTSRSVSSVMQEERSLRCTLTDRQSAIVRCIRDYIGAHGYPPTIRELGDVLGIPYQNAHQDLKRCEAKGLLTVDFNIARGIRLSFAPAVPLIPGRVAPRVAHRPVPPAKLARWWLDGTIYFIEAVGSGRVKIGFTRGPVKTRLNQIQNGAAFPLRIVATMPGSVGRENDLHRQFEDLRVDSGRSREWFRFGDEIRTFIASVTA